MGYCRSSHLNLSLSKACRLHVRIISCFYFSVDCNVIKCRNICMLIPYYRVHQWQLVHRGSFLLSVISFYFKNSSKKKYWSSVTDPVLCPKLTLIQPTWFAYPYHLVFLIWYPYSLGFLIWYPYALTSLYGNTAHCSGYSVAMGCYRLSIVRRTVIVTSQWYHRYCFMEYARTWARHPTTPWQRECTAITDCQSIDSL